MGTLQCDGYAVYNGLAIERVACMAHVRRKFFEAARVSKMLDTSVPLKLLDAMFVHLRNSGKSYHQRSAENVVVANFRH